MIKVKANPLFQEHVGIPGVLNVNGETVGQCLNDVIRQYPESKSWLFGQDSLVRVIISINTVEIVTPDKDGLNRKLSPDDEIMIFAIVSGG